MDLANLGFVVDTKSIKDGISALRELQAAALGVTNSFKQTEKAVQDAGKVTEQAEAKSTRAVKEGANEKKKAQSDYLNFLDRAIDSTFRREQANLEAIKKQLRQVKTEAELAAQGLSRTTAVGVANLRGRGASEQDINTFIRTRKEIERITLEAKKAGVATQGLSTILRQISPAVGAVGVVALFTQIGVAAIRAADQMTLLKSRMRLVLDETQDFTSTYDNLINTAVENRASLTDTVTLFVRLTPALRAAGLEAEAANKVVDSFQKTLLISGATTRETSAAILQFSQAMAAGRLNGDEFRSISEAAPEFLRAFSKATGVATGALKELSAEGVLTTEVISAAMIVMNEELTKAAAGIEINLGQAIQILGTRLTESADRINSATGFTQALAQTVFSLGETVKSVTDFIINNKDAFAGLASTLGTVLEVATTSLTIYAGLKGVLLAVSLAGAGVTAVFTGLAGAASFAQLALAKYTGSATTATVATTGLGVAVKGLMSSTGIGAIAVVLGTAAVAFSDYIFSSDEAAESSNKVTEATEEETKAIEAAKKILSDFGITYGSASGAAGEYAKKTRELTNAYIQQKVSAEGLYLIEKNLIELERAKLVVSAAKIASSEKDTETKNKEIAGIVKEIEAINDLLGIMQLTEEQRKVIEANATSRKASSKTTKDLEQEAKAAKKAAEAYANLGYDELFKKRDKNLESILGSIEATEEEIKNLDKQTDSLLLSKEALFEKELATIDAALATAELALTEELAKNETTALTFALQDQIDVLNRLKEAKGRNAAAEVEKETKDAAKKAAEDTKKEFEKIQDDIAKSVGDAIIAGGQKGKDILKNMFKAQIFRIFVEPTIRNAVGSVNSSIGSIANSASSSFGSTGIGGILQSAGSFTNLAAASNTFANTAVFASAKLAEFAGLSTAATGSLTSFAASAGAAVPYIGAVIAGVQLIKSFRGNKISATNLGNANVSFSNGQFAGAQGNAGGFVSDLVRDGASQIAKAYVDTVKSLGGEAVKSFNVLFGANTGSQGQNPQFGLGIEVGGRRLFTQGETANTEAAIQEASLRSIVALLQESNLAQNVSNILNSVRPLSSSIEDLNDALSKSQVVASLNSFAQAVGKFGVDISAITNSAFADIERFLPEVGGIEQFGEKVVQFVELFVPESEKFQNSAKEIANVFKQIGEPIPATKEAFRDLANQIANTGGFANTNRFADILNIAPAFAQALGTIEQALTQAYETSLGRAPDAEGFEFYVLSVLNGSQTLEQALDAISNSSEALAFAAENASGEVAASAETIAQAYARLTSVQKTAEQVAQERISLEEELFNLTASSTQLLESQRNALDDSNRALFDQVQAIKEQQEAARLAAEVAQERAGLETRLLQLQGNTSALRQQELNALNPANRALLQMIFNLEDATEAERVRSETLENLRREQDQAAAESLRVVQDLQNKRESILGEQTSLENRLLQLQGDTVSIRLRELAAIDPSNRALLLQVFALEDAAQAQERFNEQVQKTADELSAAQSRLAEAQSAVQSAQSEIDRIRNEATSQYVSAQQRVIEAQQKLNDLQGESARRLGEVSQSISEFLNTLRTDRFGTETPLRTRENLLAQFQSATAGALGGDADAAQRAQELARSLLEISKETFGSTSRFQSDFDFVTSELQKLVGLGSAPEVSQDPVVQAQQELAAAQQELAQATNIANTVGASLIQSQENLIQAFNQASADLAAALLEQANAQAQVTIAQQQLDALKALSSTVGNLGTAINTLRQDVVNVLVSGFDSIDLNVDGGITKAEFTQAFASFGLGDKLNSIFNEIDINGDGLISKTEAVRQQTAGVNQNTTVANINDQISAELLAQINRNAALQIQIDNLTNSLLTSGNQQSSQTNSILNAVDSNTELSNTILDLLNSQTENINENTDFSANFSRINAELIQGLSKLSLASVKAAAVQSNLLISLNNRVREVSVTLQDPTNPIIAPLSNIFTPQQAQALVSQFGQVALSSPGFSTGGYVSGSGTGTSDSIPAMLSNGEYVIRASSVRNFGVDFLNSINSGTMPDLTTIPVAVRGSSTKVDMTEVVEELRQVNRTLVNQIKVAQAAAQQAMKDNEETKEELNKMRKEQRLIKQ